MSTEKRKGNWPVVIGIGITLGLSILVISKNSLRDFNNKQIRQIQLDLYALSASVKAYKTCYGNYPKGSKDKVFNFAEKLSDVQPSIDNDAPRQMFIDYDQNKMPTDNPNYSAPNADPTKVIDPFGEAYYYRVDGENVYIWSSGPDRVNANGAESSDDLIMHIEPLPEGYVHEKK